MANPTTNYGFVLPTPTDLVTDLPADFDVALQGVDTRLKALQPGTTLGDLAYSSATANTNTRLAIGTDGQVLKVTAGVPVWGAASAGQLIETVFTSSDASFTIPTGVTGVWALVAGGGGGGGATSNASATNSGGAGGGGQVVEKYFAIVGDTTLNITVGAGGAGGTAGGKGSTGSTSSIVGNTSATTYVTAAGGGGAGGGAAANVAGLGGASSGGNGSSTLTSGGAGGGAGSSAINDGDYGFFGSVPTSIGGSSGAPTTVGVTGYYGGSTTRVWGGNGVIIWDRKLGAGGNNYLGVLSSGYYFNNFGVGASTGAGVAGNSASANSAAGGNGAKTGTTTAFNGGNGGSGLVVLRYIA
jgi:hypothetical protein